MSSATDHGAWDAANSCAEFLILLRTVLSSVSQDLWQRRGGGSKIKHSVLIACSTIIPPNAMSTKLPPKHYLTACLMATTQRFLHMAPLDAERLTPSRRFLSLGEKDCANLGSGTAQQPGIIFLTMQELFERIGDVSEEKTCEISLSYLEIYNETIRDLLVPGGSKQGLMLREDANQAVSVAGLSSHHPQNVSQKVHVCRIQR